MNCTRCGAERRRATARFCHVCGATYELAPTDFQPGITEMPAPEAAPQQAQELKPTSLTSRWSDEGTTPEKQATPEGQPPQQPAAGYPDWLKEPPPALHEQQPARLNERNRQPPEPPARLAPAASPEWGAVPSGGSQQEPFSNMAHNQALASENTRLAPDQPSRRSRPAPSVWPEEPPTWERQPQEAFPQPQASQSLDNQPPSAPQNYRGGLNQGPFAERADPPIPWQAPPAEPPLRSVARGPVPGALQRSRPVQRRRVPLGVIISLGLLLVFVIAGVGIYVFASGPGTQEPSSFQTYTDPGHHFSIPYPTVWTVKKLSNGVRFADATNTASLSVTYTPNPSNLTAEQFANQEATGAGISAPAPDTQTFAGTTWVQRSGTVTQTSGISQVIFIMVTTANNLLYEVREVTPLDGYKEPNFNVFMPMLTKLTLG